MVNAKKKESKKKGQPLHVGSSPQPAQPFRIIRARDQKLGNAPCNRRARWPLRSKIPGYRQ